ncbi:MAG: LysM domain-containing protein, partial [Chloroflexota bacterium]
VTFNLKNCIRILSGGAVMALVKVAPNKRHFLSPKGQPFFAMGINYAGYFDRAWKMWEPGLFDPTLIERDFRKAELSGFNTLRLFAHSALLDQVRRNDFTRLDQTLSLAQDHQLRVLLTLNDAHDLNLAQVSNLDAKIAGRYKDVPTVLGYDLENEPVFYNLAAAVYPAGYPAPIQTSQLVDHYGARVSRAEALDLQRNRRIPGHLDADKAFYYINALRIFLEFDTAANQFTRQGKGTLVDFMRSGEAERWRLLLDVLDGTVKAWLMARSDPVRAAGCRQLLTVGWNWLHFAALPANQQLDFLEYHNYTSLSYAGFNTNLAHLESLRRAFPHQPLVFGEFGWSNQTGTNPTGSQAVDPAQTGLYEAATYAYLRANEFAGGFKWKLNDVQITHNPYEASFGVFAVGDRPKPIRNLVERFSQDWPAADQSGNFAAVRDLESGLSYRLNLPGQIALGGHIYQDEALSWQAEGTGHCYIKIQDQQLFIDSPGAGRLAVDPWDLIPAWNQTRETNLFRVYSSENRTRLHTFGAGQSVEFEVRPGVQYLAAMGAATPIYPPPEGSPYVDPKPGEHVLLLADSDQHLQAALKYIRRFAPDFTFAVGQVAGRWAYVSIIAAPAQVPDDILDSIRGAGAQLVERVTGETIEQTKAILDELARRGQRFLTAIAPAPPQEEPPSAPGEEPAPPPTNGTGQKTYVVQPGDTLSKIAQQIYGDFRLWSLIYDANRDQISSPSLIRVGMELQIPTQDQ